MNGLTTIAQLPRSGGAGMEINGETNRRPKRLATGWSIEGMASIEAALAMARESPGITRCSFLSDTNWGLRLTTRIGFIV